MCGDMLFRVYCVWGYVAMVKCQYYLAAAEEIVLVSVYLVKWFEYGTIRGLL